MDLKVFLIQSVINALENAKQLYSYLNIKNNTATIFEQLLLKKYENIVVLNENNETIYEHYTNISLDEKLMEQIHILNTSIEINKQEGSRKYISDDYMIEIKGSFFTENRYKLFTLKKTSITIL